MSAPATTTGSGSLRRPATNTYSYLQSLLRISVAQRIHHWDWQAELAQAWVGGVPSDAVSPVTAQGQLGLGGTYYAANGNNTEPAAAFFKQGFLRYRFAARQEPPHRALRILRRRRRPIRKIPPSPGCRTTASSSA